MNSLLPSLSPPAPKSRSAGVAAVAIGMILGSTMFALWAILGLH